VSHPLVAVNKGVSLGECEAERGCLLDQAEVEVSSSEGGPRLGDGRFKGPRSRMPGAPPVAVSTRRCSSTTSPKVR
jgi:hypothetical protein